MKKLKSLFLTIFTLLMVSCNFFTSLTEEPSNMIEISSLTLNKSNIELSVGNMEYISVLVKPNGVQKDINLLWSYDKSIIECDSSSSWGFTFKAIKEGQTTLRCSYNGFEASCLITVSGYSDNYEATTEPYIYSNTSILQTGPGISEKVFVSLYGGDASDIDGYSWTVDNSSVVSIQPTGQYCVITAKEAGYARIKVSHTKATYPYYIGVYVFEDNTSVGYITTSNNIVTMNKDDGEQNISVSLVNGKDTSSDSQFKWEIIKENDTSVPIGIAWNGNNAVITPKESGSCTIRITHPDAPYPLDILCRVITIVKNVYIKPDNTVVTLSGENTQTIKSTLENLESENINIDGFNYVLDDYNVAEIVSIIGDEVTLKGKANGSCKLIISHESAEYPREVLVIVNGQLTDAIDASCYITTSQNYVRTKVGSAETVLKISLKGGEEGDEKDFTWNVKSTSKDGSNRDVISLSTTNGTAIHSRAAALTYAYGEAYINPICEGTAVISITHPKTHYPTEILVKVLSKNSILEEPLYFAGPGLIKILNGNSDDYIVDLKGDNKSSTDDEKIIWECDNNLLSVSTNANIASITAPDLGTGQTKSFITISHEKADVSKKVLVMTADDKETLQAMKALYSDKLYYNIEIGNSESCNLNIAGFEDGYDFSTLTWEVIDPSIISIQKSSFNPLVCNITGLKSGVTKLIAKIEDIECEFNITVYPRGTVATENEVYFSTSQNVIVLSEPNKSSKAYISAINLSISEYSNIVWESSNDEIVTVVGNGVSGTIMAKSEGEAVISVHHHKSQNTLKLYVRVGSEYIVPELKPLVYISSQDVITFLKDGEAQQLKAILLNEEANDCGTFSFEIDNDEIAEIISQTQAGIAYIKPKESGQVLITIKNSKTDITKQVLVVVGNSSEELASFVYLTTNSNVVALGEGTTKNISVSIKNSTSTIVDGYSWISNNPNVVDITSSGSTALLNANSIGTAILTITNKACKYPLSIIVQVVDPILASANPYIQISSSVITIPVSGNYTSITADLVGGTQEDYSDFMWKVNDTSICAVYGQNEVGKIRALAEGQTYVTVTHPKATYPAQLLVVCDKIEESECHISVPSSIISMKPNATTQTITASLINGKETDKYSFSWSLDVYDVIDFQYSANICTITPLQTGSATITISHPKAAYDQQIIINVQEYSSFNFPQTNVTLREGTTSFLTMQVPTTSVSTYVEYSVDNPDICSITGTKNVAQITGVGAGTTTVRAKLIASSSGVEQANAEMLVYVKEAETSTTYITSSSTIFTVNKGKSQTLSATLTGNGVTSSDQYNLKWTTSDSDIISITGISSDGTVSGQSIYITAKKSGEALITCSHEKAASDLQFYVVVPGSAEKKIFLNKTYITLTKGSSGAQLKATIENSESSSDYSEIEWSCPMVNDVEIARIMGNGQTVTIYPIAPGETTVIAQLPNGAKAECTLLVEAGKSFSFETSSKKVQPFHSKTIKYVVSPPDAILSWNLAQEDDYFSYRDLGCDSETGIGYVEVTGMKEGTGVLACVTDGTAKGSLTVKVAWDYEFSIDKTMISGSPDNSYEVNFKISPADANITVEGNGLSNFTLERDENGCGTITIHPKSEGIDEIIIRGNNQYNKDDLIDSFNVIGNFHYDSLTSEVLIQNINSYENPTMKAYFSEFKNDTIKLGDGEVMNFKVDIDETKTSNLSITASLQKNAENLILEPTGIEGCFSLSHTADYTSPAYVITEGYVPAYKGSTYYPDGTPIALSDFYSTTSTDSDSYDDWQNPFYYETHYDRIGKYYLKNNKTSSSVYAFSSGWIHSSTTTVTKANKTEVNGDWTIVRDKSLDGKCMSVTEFQACLWYYIPAFTVQMGGSCTSYLKHNYGEIDTDNIKASYYDISPDKTVQSSKQVDILILTISHNGKSEKKYYPIYLETRNCACTQN